MKTKAFGLFIYLLLIGFFFYFVFKNSGYIRETLSITLSHLTTGLFTALFVVAAANIFDALAFEKILNIFKIRKTLTQTALLQLKSFAASVIIPSGGVSGVMYYADDARHGSYSEGGIIGAGAFWILMDNLAISLILFITILYLKITHNLHPAIIFPAILLFSFTTLMFLVVYSSIKKRVFAQKILRQLTALIAFFMRGKLKKRFIEKASRFIQEFLDVSDEIIENKAIWFKIFFLIALKHLLNMVVLYLVFASLSLHPDLRSIFAGYAIGTTTNIISPTPNGLFFSEASMSLIFTTFGISLGVAGTAVIIYRALVFWFPFLVGFILLERERFRRLKHKN